MNIENFFENYGYLAIFIGSMFEGELIVSFAGSLCYQKVLSTPLVILLATLGTMFSEQICFYIGRYLGAKYLHKSKRFKHQIELIFVLIRKYQTTFILGCRFLYGLRTLSPFIIGASKITPRHFSIYNVIAALIWSVISVSIGYASAYVSNSLGYSNNLGYVFTFIIIFVSISIVAFFIKQFIKQLKV